MYLRLEKIFRQWNRNIYFSRIEELDVYIQFGQQLYKEKHSFKVDFHSFADLGKYLCEQNCVDTCTDTSCRSESIAKNDSSSSR